MGPFDAIANEVTLKNSDLEINKEKPKKLKDVLKDSHYKTLHHFTKIGIASITSISSFSSKKIIKELIKLEILSNLDCKRIVLTDKGKNICKSKFKPISMPSRSKQSIQQILMRSELYFTLPEEVRQTWEDQNQLIRLFYDEYPEYKDKIIEKLGFTTWIDARIKINDKYIGICIKPKSNGHKMLEQKKRIAYEYMNCHDIYEL